MDKKKAICEYLRKNHIGKENAIHSKELEKLFLLDGRSIRRKISALRQDGFPICSDETGYYYADNARKRNYFKKSHELRMLEGRLLKQFAKTSILA